MKREPDIRILLWCTICLSLITFPSVVYAQTCGLEALITKPITSTPILSWDDANLNSSGSQLKVTAAKGEFEPGSIVVRNKTGTCKDVQVTVDNLVLLGNPAVTIGKENVKIKYVKKWYQSGTAWISLGNKGTRKLVPELLLNNPLLVKVDTQQQRNYVLVKGNYVDISTSASKKGRETPSVDQMDIRDTADLQPIELTTEAQQIFFTFYAAENLTPGLYQSTVRFVKSQTTLLTVPIRFEVLPFKLEKPFLEYSIFYRSQLSSGVGTISSEQKNEQQYRAEMVNMINHGITNPNVYQSLDSKPMFTKAMEIRYSTGFTQPSFYYLGRSASSALTYSGREELSKAAAAIKLLCQPIGYSDLYLFGTDEAVGTVLHQQLPSWQYTKTLGFKVFTTGYAGTYDGVGTYLDLLVLAGEPNQEEVQKFHSASKRVMTYAYPQSGPEDPLVFRRNYGLNLWAQKVDGAMNYAYQDAFGFIWNDFDHEQYRDHNFTYPTSNGVIDTLAWEGFREGVDDVRYLTTLKNMLEKVRGTCATQTCTSTVTTATATFESFKVKANNRDLDAARGQIIAAIQSLLPIFNGASPPSPPTIGTPSP